MEIPENMKRVAIVILNWNGKNLLEKFLPALVNNTDRAVADCIVADNASADDSLIFLQTHYPQLQVIALDKNYGFAEGYNKALAFLEKNYEYVVLLNSDVEVTSRWLNPMISYLDKHPEIVAAQPKILSFHRKEYFEYAGAAGGYLDYYAYPFCRGRILQTIEQDHHQYDDIRRILWASGACLFIRLQDYIEAGGLDPVFFAHQEEIDLCWRLNAQGKGIVCIPESVVYHVGGATLALETPQKTFLNFRNNLLMIYKNVPERRLRKVLFVRYLLDGLAALMFLLKGHSDNAKAVYQAGKAFRKLRPEYQFIRKELQEKALPKEPEQLQDMNLIEEYYLRGRKKFTDYLF
jgi:GT2 family glycosyltransferase